MRIIYPINKVVNINSKYGFVKVITLISFIVRLIQLYGSVKVLVRRLLGALYQNTQIIKGATRSERPAVFVNRI